jgi:hypothetical protein
LDHFTPCNSEVKITHCGAFAADFAERVEEEEEGLEEGVEVQAVPESSPVDIQQQLSALSKLSPE